LHEGIAKDVLRIFLPLVWLSVCLPERRTLTTNSVAHHAQYILLFGLSMPLYMKTSAATERAILKLVTQEDPYHIHKCFGILALLHCAGRLALYYCRDGDDEMGFGRYPAWTVPTMLLHICLSLTSFVFAIPRQRIKSGGWRI
jgi:hypothetical protein